MLFSYNWLQEYFVEKLPKTEDLADLLCKHSFEIEGVVKTDDDYLLDIDILPNRAHDCLSYFGIAREIATLTGLEIQFPNKFGTPTTKSLKSGDFIALSLAEAVVEAKVCPRAMKRFVTQVKIGPSPDWLIKKLASQGQKSINNIVDTTNLVMFETGQPVHCFDFDKLVGADAKDIIIRFAKAGEKIISLDNKEYELDEKTLVISDAEKALDIAGIKGGASSGIDATTKNIVLSVCNFNSVNIRKTAKRLGLRTDASARFENGLSPEKTAEALERLSQLVVELASGEVAEDILDIYPRPAPKYKVGVSLGEVNKLLGAKITEDEISEIFSRMGVGFEKIKPLDKILELAKTLEGKPYQYGASVSYDAPNAFDCSSFTAYLFAQAGIAIPRVSIDQYFFGEEISENELQAGDLVFAKHSLDNSEEKSFMRISDGKMVKQKVIHTESQTGERIAQGVDHAGLYLGDGKIIFASGIDYAGKVVIENLHKSESFKTIIGCRRYSKNQKRFVVEIPHNRLDLRIKEDLIEEIGRIYGYENIAGEFPRGAFKPPAPNKIYQVADKIRDILAGVGFSETYGYSLVEKGEVELANPFTVEKGFLRTDLLSGLEITARENLRYFDEVKIFEIGKIFWKENPNPADGQEGVGEKFSFSAILDDKKTKKREELFFEIKGVVELVLRELGIQNCFFEPDTTEKFMALIRIENGDGKTNEIVGRMSQNGFEMDLEKLADSARDLKIYKTPSKYPSIGRDIALFVPSETPAAEVEQIIKKSAGDLLVNLELFDIFQKPNEDKKSLAFRLVLQSSEKTLLDEEANAINDKIVVALEKNSDWEVRK